MADKQIITVSPEGALSGLQRKPGQGVDLRQFGQAAIERASLIEWAEDMQGWYINVLQEAGKGRVHKSDLDRVGVSIPDHAPYQLGHRFGCLYFAEYEHAVEVEILYLDALRRRGRF